MNGWTKSSNRPLLYAGIVILLLGVLFVLLRSREPTSAILAEVSSPLTPTPYPLPTTAYDLTLLSTVAPGDVPEETDLFLDPARMKAAGKLQAEQEYFDLYTIDDYLPIDMGWWEQATKPVYEYASQRLDSTLREKAIVIVAPPEAGNCPARGRTFREQPLIVIFADERTSKEQILGVLAHELGHLLSFEKYKHLTDLALTEGIATWAAGEYWERWQGYDFDSGVQSFLTRGTYLPLSQNYQLEKAYQDSSNCLTQRDILYTEFAAFIEYLMERDGPEKLSRLFDVPPLETIDHTNIIYPPDYKGVYGLELNQLEQEWLKTLVQQNP